MNQSNSLARRQTFFGNDYSEKLNGKPNDRGGALEAVDSSDFDIEPNAVTSYLRFEQRAPYSLSKERFFLQIYSLKSYKVRKIFLTS